MATTTTSMSTPRAQVTLRIERAANISLRSVGALETYVLVTCGDRKYPTRLAATSDPIYDEAIDLGEVSLDDGVSIKLVGTNENTSVAMPALQYEIGRAHVTVRNILDGPRMELLLLTPDETQVVIKPKHNKPSLLYVSIDNVDTLPSDWPRPRERTFPKEKFPKHVMVVSRGTRGDVQPFVALARGLAERLGWLVTICTELRFRNFVKKYANVRRGAIRFRPSGGDTEVRINSWLGQWALKSKSEIVQAAMMARTEAEFFPSEPVLYFWAEKLQPDLLIYGFTMAAVTSILSEKLGIPMLGFILQPTCIPSNQYPAVVPVTEGRTRLADKIRMMFLGHGNASYMKGMMETRVFSEGLNNLRRRRGLEPITSLASTTWYEISRHNSPIVVPIEEICFGGRPIDWNTNHVLTQFIFLRTPGTTSEIPPELRGFIETAKREGAPIVVLAFSSMPVGRAQVLGVATLLALACRHQPRIIALGASNHAVVPEGGQKWTRFWRPDCLDRPSALQRRVDRLKEAARLIEVPAAPYDALFPLADCVVHHGGLGTTAETLLAGVPSIVTGLLLLDQRFWGTRVAQLGVGPDPVHMDQFLDTCVQSVDRALDPQSDWRRRAKEIAEKLKGGSNDGVAENVEAVERLGAVATPFFIE